MKKIICKIICIIMWIVFLHAAAICIKIANEPVYPYMNFNDLGYAILGALSAVSATIAMVTGKIGWKDK